MTARCYELGLIPCTKTKNPIGVTPLTLYRSSPFALMLRHAQQRCRRILIMSAKYGLLQPDDRITYYDAYLPTLTPEQRFKLQQDLAAGINRLRLLEVNPSQVLCYLPRVYYSCLLEVDALEEWVPFIHRPYKSLPSLTLMKVLSNEIKGFETPGLARR